MLTTGDAMESAAVIIQIIIPLGIFNFWFLRLGKSTKWRVVQFLDNLKLPLIPEPDRGINDSDGLLLSRLDHG